MINNIVYTSNKYRPYFDYWKGIRSGSEKFNFTLSSPPSSSEGYNKFSCKITAENTRLIIARTKGRKGNLVAEIIAAFSFLLFKYTGQQHIILHTPLYQGTLTEKVMEPFVPICIGVNEDVSLKDFSGECLTSIKTAYQFQNFPLSLVRKNLGSNILLMLEDFHHKLPEKAWFGNYGLVAKIFSLNDSISISLTFKESEISAWFIHNFVNHLNTFFNHYANIECKLSAINILPASEWNMIGSFSNFKKDYPSDKTIHGLFEDKVGEYADKKALVDKDITFTYRELNEKINQLAHLMLMKYNVKPGDIVAMCLQRSPWQLICMLAIMKAGGVYLPIDNHIPYVRFNFIIEDAGVKLIITDDSTDEFYKIPLRTLRIDDVHDLPKYNPGIYTSPLDPAYIIYTSGTTGQPKGVVIAHRGVVNMSTDQIRRFGISSDDRIAAFAAVSFDASVSEYLMALYAGSAVGIIHESEIKDPRLLLSNLKQNKITVLTLPPAYLNMLEAEKLMFLRVLITAGEPADPAKAAVYSQFLEYYNAYGPTEYTVCTTIYKIIPGNEYGARIPIGTPIANTGIYVLDGHKNPVPIGIPGKLYISGVGLSTGYLNRSALTAEKFIPDLKNTNEVMYDTGDLVRWLPDGNLDFLGRADELVKIDGIRVEPEEVRLAIQKHPDVKNCLVLPVSIHGNTRLAAFITLSDHADVPDTALELHLRKILPGYMIPFRIVVIQEFPLNSSGKVDREKLLELLSSSSYTAPSNKHELMMQEIWQSVLDISPIGRTDNFFKLGASSIDIIALYAVLIKDQPDFDVRLIFKHPVLKDFSAAVLDDKNYDI